MTELTPDEIASLVELTEAQAWADYYRCASPEFARQYGVRTATLQSARITMLSRLDWSFFNRIDCLGVGAPATEATLDAAIRILEDAGCTRYTVALSPVAQPPHMLRWLEPRGFRFSGRTAKLYRGAEPPPEVRTALRVERIGPDYADAFSEIALAAFEMPSELFPFMSCHLGHPGWTHYMAFDGDLPVSTACMFMADEAAWLGFAATRLSHRGRGAQSALFARRIADGLQAGCKRFVVETGEDTPESPNPSYRNMPRAGFRLAYLRPNYVREPSAAR